jgi:ubiquinol-cytochrome c reductase iron-sulfur subunit
MTSCLVAIYQQEFAAMQDRTGFPPAEAAADPHRRDVLLVATGAVGMLGVIGAVGTAVIIVPRLDRTSPGDFGLVQADALDLDISSLEPGQQIMVFWRTWPVLVVRRTLQAIATLQDPVLVAQLADPESKQPQQPPYAVNWQRSIKPEFAVLVGVCTHMGCIPAFHPQPNAKEPEPDWLGGYLCPCHGSKYDLAGRVFKGVPAPYNLPVPPYRFVNERTIRIGENPPDVKFDFRSILQI